MAAIRIAEGLVIAALVLLIIYGADEGVAQGDPEGGFLPLDAVTRGFGFGGTAVALSTAAFFVAIREKSNLVSSLLVMNGILVIIGGAMAGAYHVLGMGVWIVALGIVKFVRARAVKVM